MPTRPGDRFALKPIDAVLDEIDADIALAADHRTVTWRKLIVRDDQANRDAYNEASDYLDRLLDMRNEMLRAERMVTP
jgi:hypothetical protein